MDLIVDFSENSLMRRLSLPRVVFFLGSILISQRAAASFFDPDGPLHVVVMGVDISLLIATGIAIASLVSMLLFRAEVRSKARSLRETEQRFEGLVSNIPGAVYRCAPDAEWTMAYVSDAIEGIVGYPADEFIANRLRSYASVVHPNDRERVESEVNEANRKRSPFEIEYRVIHRDGEWIWVREKGRAIFEPDGRIRHLDGVIFDITSQKILSDLVLEQQARMAASARLSALGEMAGGIAHEINNPLAVIQGRAGQLRQVLLEETFERAQLIRMAESIETTCHRISKIIRSLRSIARDGGQEPFERMNLKPILDETLELCRQRMMNHGIELRIDPFEADLAIDCRPVEISQVLINLLNNAHDAILDLPEKFIHLQIVDRDSDIEIRIKDSGSGIPSRVLDRMFQPFFTTKEVGSGTGLGLSLSRAMIAGHHGRLEIDVKEAHTCFVISLPKLQRKTDSASGAA